MGAKIVFKYSWQENSWNSRNEISGHSLFYRVHNNTILCALEIVNLDVGIK
jgi:hypothetical protein